MLVFCTLQKLDRGTEVIHSLASGNKPLGCGMEQLETPKRKDLHSDVQSLGEFSSKLDCFNIRAYSSLTCSISKVNEKILKKAQLAV